MRLHRIVSVDAGVVLAALIFAWLCTLPSAIALINWDNAAYIAEMASGGYDWSHLPWSSHLGIGQEYLIGVWLARAFGGTVIDGFRLVNAVAFAATCWILFDTSRRLTESRLQAGALVLLWATTWVNFHYQLILEDNFLFLAPGAVMFRICVLRVDQWRARDSIACGFWGLLAFLGSIQALPYVGVAVYAALLGPGRTMVKRLRDVALVAAGFVGSLLGWMVIMATTSALTWKKLSHQVLMGPDPFYMPRSAGTILKYIFDGHSLFETLGNGLVWNLSFHAYKLPGHLIVSKWTLGLLATLFLAAVFVYATWWSWRKQKWAPHVMASILVLLAFATALHRDVDDFIGLKRFDFVPLIFVFLGALALGQLAQTSAKRKFLIATVALAAIVAPIQFALGLRWSLREQARYVATSSWNATPHPEPMQYGREGKSWFHYFRDLGREHRDACTLVLSYGEVSDSTWNFDITGSLYSEVKNHMVVLDDGMDARFRPRSRRVVPHLSRAAEAKIPPCAWVSQAASELLAANHR
jgi:hypothetical protein